ncbi:MAG: succinyldiaminopimelate transaminase [Alcanivoracaceae bacterium]|nr:succinyldiaminopimelate transaminase [Alcanivoracaceae bacterium]
MNPDLNLLHPYPFEKLAKLFSGHVPVDKPHIALSIGEPQHPAPAFVQQIISSNTDLLAKYPSTVGIVELRQSIANWLQRRYAVQVDCDSQVLPVNGTREALFAFAQTVLDHSKQPLVLMPNPFYQIYEGAALLAGGEPVYLPCTEHSALQPDFSAVPESVWQRCQLLYVCSPGNPTGAVMSIEQMRQLIDLADRYDFVIASDECYADIYSDTPPPGLLQACAAIGRHDFRRCVVFHSLSKRSNLPGMRSGFVAGDATVLSQFLRYRTYHGCAMPMHHQIASIAAWDDDRHAADNRVLYQQKFDAVLEILGGVLDVSMPDAGFYLWPKTAISDETFALELKRQQNVTVLPGRYLSREIDGLNPGAGRVRMALVASLEECIEGAKRIREFVGTL